MVSGSTLTVIKISHQVRDKGSQKMKSHKIGMWFRKKPRVLQAVSYL